MKIKMLMPVLTVVVFLGLANTAFAQLSCSVASTPVSRDTDTGHTEVAGDLIFNCVGGATATTAATITVDYGVVITNSTTYPAAKPISVANTSGSFTGGGLPTIAAVNNATGQVVITIPAQAAPAAGSFTLTGILVSLAGSGKTTLVANVSVSPGNNVLITAGQNVATVITTILPGIKAPTLTTTTPIPSSGLLLTTGIVIFPGFSVDVQENYIDMYRDATQFNGGASTNSTRLQYTFANIPTGVTLTGCSVSATSGAPIIVGGGTTVTSSSNTVQIEFAAPVNQVALDTVTFACTGITVGSTATVPLTPANVTVTVTLAPTGSALSSTGGVLTSATTGQIPRYQATQLPSPPLTVIAISPAQTVMLVPFAVVNASGFDTGLAVSNTTTDPFGATGGGARNQGGSVSFTFFPQTGSSCTVTPSGSTVGTGFSSTGAIESGRTVTVLASELLRTTGSNCPTVFTGYIFIVANFTHGHGSAFVSDFRGFTSASNVLILPPPSFFSRALQVFEALNH